MNAVADEMTQRGVPLIDEPMRKHTSWRVGGPADLFYEPASVAELQEILAKLPAETPVLWLGLGSNLLVRDGGIRGAVIATSGLPRELERYRETGVRAGAGLPCALLARQCVRWQLGPAAFSPAFLSVGGALAMNAGAFGGETWTHVESDDDRSARRHSRARVRTCGELPHVRGPVPMVSRATFALAPDQRPHRA
jgi:UDP-N-acetylmuramate dehydrogenase